MRVLHIVSFYRVGGGVARAARLLAGAQARIGADVTFFSTGSDLEERQLTTEREDRGCVR